ncbi:MAG: arylsulfotransferase family protein [Chitinophagales bacterium]
MRGFLSASSVLFLFLFHAINALGQFEYIFPSDSSRNNFRETHLILRNGSLMDPSSITSDKIELIGSHGGKVDADVVLSTDGKTICITPVHSFNWSENVQVNVKDGFQTLDGQTLKGTSFQFSVRREMTQQEKQNLDEYLSTHDDDDNLINDPNQQSTYIPCPQNDLRTNHFAFVNIYTNTNPAPGEIFFHRNLGGAGTFAGKGYGIMESGGDSVFFRPSTYYGANFHINLNGYLTLYEAYPGVDSQVIVLDSNYNMIDSVHCKNGLTASQHEHIFLSDGTKWFTCYDWQQGWDLSQYGGGQSATVNVCWIQELDQNNNVIFQWRSDNHFSVTDATSDILAQIGQTFYDPWHMNSMYKDNDGMLIVSFRNMDMIVKINPANGNIVWYWTNNTSNPNFNPRIVTTGDGDGLFSHQHNVHRIDNGHILMFDNGNLHTIQQSKPKEYSLDETNFTANLVWSYAHPQVNGFNMYTKNQGSAQRLSNGNTFIGYGLPNIAGLYNGTEIDANKNIVWEFRFKDSTEYSYRLYKNVWSPVGISTIDVSNQLSIFPNPSNGQVTMKMDFPLEGKVMITVSNILGQQVYTQSANGISEGKSLTLDLSSLGKGFYFVQLQAGKMKAVNKILLQ